MSDDDEDSLEPTVQQECETLDVATLHNLGGTNFMNSV